MKKIFALFIVAAMLIVFASCTKVHINIVFDEIPTAAPVTEPPTQAPATLPQITEPPVTEAPSTIENVGTGEETII